MLPELSTIQMMSAAVLGNAPPDLTRGNVPEGNCRIHVTDRQGCPARCEGDTCRVDGLAEQDRLATDFRVP